MCGRFVTWFIDVYGRLMPRHIFPPYDYEQSFDFRPSQDMPIVIIDQDSFSVEIMKWGYLPSNLGTLEAVKEFKRKFPKTFNTRCESINKSPMYRNPKRCIVPTMGWYEWKSTDAGKEKFFVKHKADKPFAYAGVYNYSRVLDQLTFSVVTTAAQNGLEDIHHRQPVALSQDDYDAWLEGHLSEKDVQEPMMNDQLEWYEVPNKPKNKSDFTKPIDEAEEIQDEDIQPDLFS